MNPALVLTAAILIAGLFLFLFISILIGIVVILIGVIMLYFRRRNASMARAVDSPPSGSNP